MKKLLYLLIVLSPLCYAQTDTVTIYFDTDQFLLTDQDKAKLTAVKAEIKQNTAVIESVQAHTDTTGNTSYNEQLSIKRLNSVLRALTNDPRGLSTRSFGESVAAEDLNYSASEYRKVDVILFRTSKEEVEIVEEGKTDEEKLDDELNAFLTDSTSEALIQLSVNFYPGRAVLLEGEEAELYTLYRFLKNHPKVKAKIRGHVCCGSNMALSENRAFVVYDYLVGKGISPTRLTHRGYDNTQPFVWPEETEEDKSKNRRVDVIFTK